MKSQKFPHNYKPPLEIEVLDILIMIMYSNSHNIDSWSE